MVTVLLVHLASLHSSERLDKDVIITMLWYMMLQNEDMLDSFLDKKSRIITLMVDEVEEKSAIDNDDVLSRFGKALQFGLDQPLERIADTFKSFGFNDTEKFLRDLITEQPENYVSAAEKFMQNNGMGYSWEYLPRAVVEQIGSLAGNIATRAAGAGIGGAVAGPGGAIAGALTAPALFEAIQILGPTVYERARNEGREEPTFRRLVSCCTYNCS